MKNRLINGLLSIVVVLLLCVALVECEAPQEKAPKFSTTDMVEFIDWDSCLDPSNNGIKLHSSRNDVVFECKADEGTLTLGEESGKELIAKPGDIIHWFYEKGEYLAFVEVLMKSGEDIVGYALIELYQYGWSYQPILLESEVCNAKKTFNKEYIVEVIENAKDYFPKINKAKMQVRIKQAGRDIEYFYKEVSACRATYYGKYNGAMVLYLTPAYVDYMRTESHIVSGIKFGTDIHNIWDIFVIKNGKVYNIVNQTEEILNKGILTQRDIEIIGSLHAKKCSGKYV